MTLYELAAVGAASCWALSSLISGEASQHLGAIAFNRTRMAIVLVMLGGWTAISGGMSSIEDWHWTPILLSGFIGIFLGDTALFLTLNRLGPRRTSILFSLNAPLSAFLGWLALDEVLTGKETIGILVVFAGVIIAIAFGKRRSQLHQWEKVKGSLAVGVLLGLIAALCQATGSLIARPVMASGADPIAVSAVRVAVAVLFLSLLMAAPFERFHQQNAMTRRVFAICAITGFLGMAAGMTLILYALSGGEVGIVTTLSATSPALMLPFIWLKTGERPAGPAWLGAVLAVIGSGLIFGVFG